MPLIIGKGKTKTVDLRDPVAGVRIVFTYRRPTADEQVAFQVDSLRREGDKIIQDRYGAGLRHMRPAIVSFSFPEPDKAICIEDKDGELHPLSKVNEDPGFNKHWYRLLLEYVPAIMIELGANIFGGVLRNAEAPAEPPKDKTGKKGANPKATKKNKEKEAPN